jgi:uncharacterized protein
MRAQFVTAAIVSVLGTAVLGAQAPSPCSGRWAGAIILPTASLEFELDFKLDAQSTCVGTITIPSQGANNIPLEKIVMRADSAVFMIAGVPGEPTFKGVRTNNGRTIAGAFTQGGSDLTFSATQIGAPTTPPDDAGGSTTTPAIVLPTRWSIARR